MAAFDDPFDLKARGDSSGDNTSIFSIKGELDGEKIDSFSELSQFIGLMIEKEEFLLPIALVSEIIMVPTITHVPQAPKFISGVINLRGNIIPTINLREMMGLKEKSNENSDRVIVVRFNDFLTGLVVDGITYVLALGKNEIENNVFSGKTLASDLISGIANRGDKVSGILSVEKIILTVAGGKMPASEASDE